MINMVVQTGITVGGNKKEFQGLSTDTKPTLDIGGGSTFYELDTKKGWVFDLGNVNPATNNNWWEV
jgi:hypothetical protein